MTQAHQVASEWQPIRLFSCAQAWEQSGAFEKFKTTATASRGQSPAARLKMGNGFMTSIFLKPI